ncbi:hypothetical protein [Streptomyces achromogenes]|uniref:hypothetical protein n=1 Tax=Streptomyces achromogenes TaxID=67255 RepID=UPI0037015B0B
MGLHRALLAIAPERTCLVAPLVSTTFASLGRMFAQPAMRPWAGCSWMRVGQAAPQEAVGVLW